jgi:hypothetical protein
MGAFDYTQKSFWRGVWYPYWSLIVISVLGGFIGLDHWWLRSPVSGVLKFFGNIFTLGLWYFYDILQIVSEPDNVKTYGLSMPFFGGLGIGAGMFKDPEAASEPEAKAPFRYFAYVLLTLLPFGFDYFLAGDTMGAAARFLTSIFFLLWPIGFIWGCVNTFRAVFMPEHLFTKGMYRMFPFSLFMDTYGPSKLGPVDLGPEEDKCGTEEKGFFGTIFSWMFGWIPLLLAPIVNTVLPGLAPASAAVGAAVQAGATTAKVAANSASAVIQAATAPAAAAVGTVSTVVQKAPEAIAAIPSVASAASSGLAAATSPEGLKKLAAQAGGGLANVDMSNVALFVVFTVVVGGGSLLALQRILNLNGIQLFKQKEETNGEKSDSPPEPRGIRGNAASAPRN